MRKAIALPLVVLTVLFGISLCNSCFLNQNTARWSHQLQQAAEFVQTEDWDRAEQILKESYADWTVRKTYLCIVSTHDEVYEAEALYARTRTLAALREDSEIQTEIRSLQAQLQAMAEMEALSIRNIL